jgi:alpha,alpha-trehalase
MQDGSVLNRYWDDNDTPRPEAYTEDKHIASLSGRDPNEVYRHIRAAAESGWDFSSRWFADGADLATIHTTDFVPVDLNCLLQHLETVLARASRVAGDATGAAEYEVKAAARKEGINRYCWSESAQWYVDYDVVRKAPSDALTLAGAAPFFFQIAPASRASSMAACVKEHFLCPGGAVTTLKRTGQQWDAPNGWAPLQWMVISGLRNYGQDALAEEVARRWIRVNVSVFRRTGKLMEKYDVMDLGKEGGGGEYPSQDGFGWTNGVTRAFLEMYPDALAKDGRMH